MSDYDFSMSLAVRHPDIHPERITEALGLQPGHLWCKGEGRLDEAGVSLGGTHAASYWVSEIVPRPLFSAERADIEGELAHVLQLLRGSGAFLQSVHAEGGATELHVTILARGDLRLDLPPHLMATLGRMALGLRIEVRRDQPSTVSAAS